MTSPWDTVMTKYRAVFIRNLHFEGWISDNIRFILNRSQSTNTTNVTKYLFFFATDSQSRWSSQIFYHVISITHQADYTCILSKEDIIFYLNANVFYLAWWISFTYKTIKPFVVAFTPHWLVDISITDKIIASLFCYTAGYFIYGGMFAASLHIRVLQGKWRDNWSYLN